MAIERNWRIYMVMDCTRISQHMEALCSSKRRGEKGRERGASVPGSHVERRPVLIPSQDLSAGPSMVQEQADDLVSLPLNAVLGRRVEQGRIIHRAEIPNLGMQRIRPQPHRHEPLEPTAVLLTFRKME